MLDKKRLVRMIDKKRDHRLFRLAMKAEKLRRKREAQYCRLESLWKATINRVLDENMNMLPGSRKVPGFGIVSCTVLGDFRRVLIGDPIAIVANNNRIIDGLGPEAMVRQAGNAALTRITGSNPCMDVGDSTFHGADLESIVREIMKYINGMREGGVLLTPESFKEYVEATCRMLECILELRCGVMHANILSQALEVELACVKELMGTLNLARMDVLMIEPGVRLTISSLREREDAQLARLLLETLYPREADWRLGHFCPKEHAGGAPAPPRPADKLAEKVRETIDAADEELREYRGEFGEDAGKIAKAISAARAGASKKLAVFAVENSLDDLMLSFLIDAEELICPMGADYIGVVEALEWLSPENRERLLGSREILEKAAGWLSLMPNYLRGNPALAFLLGLHFDVPANRAEAHVFLAGHEDAFVNALLENDRNLGNLENDCNAFREYLGRFARREKPAEEAPEEATPCRFTPPPAMHMRPHESLEFSETALEAMKEEGVDPEDAKIMLVCSLRLNSAKGARGSSYFNVAVFRRNCDRDLREERKGRPDGEANGRKMCIERRRERTERFLARHGVLSYYKSAGDVVRLNVGNCSTRVDAVGEDILGSVVRWMREFQKETA